MGWECVLCEENIVTALRLFLPKLLQPTIKHAEFLFVRKILFYLLRCFLKKELSGTVIFEETTFQSSPKFSVILRFCFLEYGE
jgi:hypothetical protein